MTTAEQGLLDTFGRRAVDLRVSLTDRCNLRCTYCMPEEGMQWLAKDTLLTDDEIVRLVGIAVRELGIREVRFTGGEPLLRPGLVGIVARCAELTPRPELSLTTNGIGLARTASALKAAGLDRINVSLDTLDRETFRTLSRRDRQGDVMAGLAAAEAAGLLPVKLNAVLMRGVNDHEAPDLLAWSLERGYELRFIEQMPLDAQHGWVRTNMITAEEILERLSARFTLTPEPSAARGAAPAERWLVDGGPGRVGVIASVTRPFCRACDRTRLTADGQVRNCLFATEETDLRGALRAGGADTDIAELWRKAMWGKKAAAGTDAPAGIEAPAFHQPARPMSAIGG
ncbi:GTP 3',8-cyclase MoaA [Streptacidiphilus neutrinimicus]|uniref:GTP 3',8-cyclase MoaA n=1 Tax=Streptacidiphilus neutrinimicus TaxID=105420 RepID=UPI000AF6B267|nr:GTP 3',8-cyclase MoaA [Streptacidiphilus neutrinimicus]